MRIEIKAVQGKITLEEIPCTQNINVLVQRENQIPQSVDVDINELHRAIECFGLKKAVKCE